MLFLNAVRPPTLRAPLPPPRPSRAANMGIKTRNVVRRGWDSHSTVPPWSPMSFATSARPRPVPDDFVVTNGSNRCAAISGGTPGPLSRTQNSSGRLTGVDAPGTRILTPGLNAVESSIVPSIVSGPEGLRGILDQVQEHLNQLIPIGEDRRQRWVVGVRLKRMCRANPAWATRFTWSRTAWMLTLSRSDRPDVGEGLHTVSPA